MQAVITAFPDAKMMSLRQRTVAVVPTTSDDVGAIDMPIETTEPED
jgi:hypothetical protein